MLKKHTRLDENIFRTHAFNVAPKDFIIWTALDEVEKAAVALINLDEFVFNDAAWGKVDLRLEPVRNFVSRCYSAA